MCDRSRGGGCVGLCRARERRRLRSRDAPGRLRGPARRDPWERRPLPRRSLYASRLQRRGLRLAERRARLPLTRPIFDSYNLYYGTILRSKIASTISHNPIRLNDICSPVRRARLARSESLDPHPVIGRHDILRQTCDRASRSRGRCAGWSGSRAWACMRSIQCKRLVEAEMRGMAARSASASTIQTSSPSRNCRLRFGNVVDVGRIGEAAEAEPERGDVAVVEVERHRLDRAARRRRLRQAYAGRGGAFRSRSADRSCRAASRKYSRTSRARPREVGASM